MFMKMASAKKKYKFSNTMKNKFPCFVEGRNENEAKSSKCTICDSYLSVANICTINSQIGLISRPGDKPDDVQSREFMNKQSSNLCTVPKERLLSNGRTTSQCKSRVQILHREAKSPNHRTENHSTDSRTVSNQKSSKHCKSLQQREAEYAEARLRIFGCQPRDNNENGSQTERNLAKTAGGGIQRQRTSGVVKAASSLRAPSAVANHPKGTLLRRPTTNGADNIVTQLDHS